jgi:hypothetical protein
MVLEDLIWAKIGKMNRLKIVIFQLLHLSISNNMPGDPNTCTSGEVMSRKWIMKILIDEPKEC